MLLQSADAAKEQGSSFANNVLMTKKRKPADAKGPTRFFLLTCHRSVRDTPVVEPQEEAWRKAGQRFCRGLWI